MLSPMKTVQMTLDDVLVEEVDRAATHLGTTRSAFTRDALRAALTNLKERELERRHRAGYERQPVKPGELDDWEAEQVWGDE
jgi:metal-responsive CopG/Arc/MetJ family transcriptional regulator